MFYRCEWDKILRKGIYPCEYIVSFDSNSDCNFGHYSLPSYSLKTISKACSAFFITGPVTSDGVALFKAPYSVGFPPLCL